MQRLLSSGRARRHSPRPGGRTTVPYSYAVVTPGITPGVTIRLHHGVQATLERPCPALVAVLLHFSTFPAP